LRSAGTRSSVEAHMVHLAVCSGIRLQAHDPQKNRGACSPACFRRPRRRFAMFVARYRARRRRRRALPDSRSLGVGLQAPVTRPTARTPPLQYRRAVFIGAPREPPPSFAEQVRVLPENRGIRPANHAPLAGF
jgi:hypothetical protein